MFAPEFTEFPFPFAFEAAAGVAEADVADLVGLVLFEFEFDEFITPFFAEFSAAVEFSLLFGEIGKSSSVASLLSTRRFLLGGVAVVKDSALLDI
jgi:hypothetical protein